MRLPVRGWATEVIAMRPRQLRFSRPALLALVPAVLFGLIACSSGGGGGSDDTDDSGTPEAPDAPTGVNASSGIAQVTVSWDEVEEAASYNIYWADSSGVEPATGDLLAVSGAAIEDVTSPYVHEELTAGNFYYYVVTAVNEGGESGPSEEAGAMAFGAGGALDETFSGDGIVTHHGTVGAAGFAVALDSSGRIVVAGVAGNGVDTDLALWRFTDEGDLDTSFGGGDGFVTHHNAAGGNGDDSVNAVAIDSSGRIFVAGYSVAGLDEWDLALWCFTSAGELDPSFGGGGVVTHGNVAGGGLENYGYGLAIDSSDRIVVTALGLNLADDGELAVLRYTSTGELDTSFGGDGVVNHDDAAGGDGPDEGRAAAIDSSGRIVVAGSSYNGSNQAMTLWRFSDSGGLDTSFGGGDGFVTHDGAAGGAEDRGWALAIDSAGRIVVGGYSYTSELDSDMVLWRFTDSGELDTSFGGGDGVVTHHNAAGGGGDDSGRGVAIDSEGRIVVAGISHGGPNSFDLALWRFTSAGELDPTFGAGGIVTHHDAAGGNGTDAGRALALDTSARIVAAGSSLGGASSNNTNGMALWRFWP